MKAIQQFPKCSEQRGRILEVGFAAPAVGLPWPTMGWELCRRHGNCSSKASKTADISRSVSTCTFPVVDLP